MELFASLISSKYFYYILACYGFMFVTLFGLVIKSIKTRKSVLAQLEQRNDR